MIPPFTSLDEIRRLPPRPRDAHKGISGRVAIVAGSRGMSGAAVLCGLAALRGGAGLVRVYCPASIQPIVATSEPCLMTVGLDEDAQGRLTDRHISELAHELSDSDVVALGPGMGRSAELLTLVHDLYRHLHVPLVLDADGLNAMAEFEPSDWALSHPSPRILTPHPGEMERLPFYSSPVSAHRNESAWFTAQSTGATVVLKGHETVVTDAVRIYENETGNPGMAVGGTGDVLTGLIAALMAQNVNVHNQGRLSPFEVAALAVHVHGRAGDRCAARIGPIGFLAREVADELPGALQEIL